MILWRRAGMKPRDVLDIRGPTGRYYGTSLPHMEVSTRIDKDNNDVQEARHPCANLHVTWRCFREGTRSLVRGSGMSGVHEFLLFLTQRGSVLDA